MSTRYNNGSHYENHRRAAELHDGAAHAHRSAAEQHGKQDHLTGQELSRQALEHSRTAFERSTEIHKAGMAAHEIATFGHAEIAARAHELWVAKGSPKGSADADWYEAAEELRSSTAPVHPPAED
jgi:hypothetical protein